MGEAGCQYTIIFVKNAELKCTRCQKQWRDLWESRWVPSMILYSLNLAQRSSQITN